MKSVRVMYVGIVGGLLSLVSCQPVPDDGDLLKNMVVQTTLDKTADFSSYSTYALQLDTIGQVYTAYPTDTIITGTYGSITSREVKKNLDSFGYVQAAVDQNPDLAINVFVLRNFDIYQSVSYPGYYGGFGYPGYYYPSYYGYGGYYSYPTVTDYAVDSGTLVIEFVDLKNKDASGNVKVVWTALIGDVISSTDRNAKTLSAIDDAFAQSTYLKKSQL